jgi:hypothetical protein
MTVEAVSFINDLNTSLPDENNKRLEGDDHIRNLKVALKNTFPGVAGRWGRVQEKVANYGIVLNDNSSIIVCLQGITLTLPAVATLGNGWSVWVEARVGTTIIDPSGTELINGAATLSLTQGMLARVICEGTKFTAYIQETVGSFPLGTRMLFQQTTAPLGWTKETNAAFNDSALRLVTGAVTSHGGSALFSGVFTTDGARATGGHSLTVAELAAHSHTQVGTNITGALAAGGVLGDMGTAATGVTGENAAHTHPLIGFDIAYSDVIIATKA